MRGLGAAEVAIRTALGLAPDQPARFAPAGGSSLNDTWRLDVDADRFFVKTNAAAALPMLRAEAAGLALLADAHALRVPRPLAVGEGGDRAFLVLEWLDLESGGRDAALGIALAAMHAVRGPQFGLDHDNTIGTTLQPNAWASDWATFVRERRLAPQLALVSTRGPEGRVLLTVGERLLTLVPRLLQGHDPAPSLVHGDLWSGNAARLRPTQHGGAPVVFDPAAYYGDRETDLAMTELFGGFEPSFHAAYREAAPLPAGYPMRRTLYNLYHVLNHFNLFGGSYGTQALDMMRRLLAEAG